MKEKLKILIVEDVASEAEILVHELKHEGLQFEKLIIETKESFINALDTFKPDIILSDYNLPQFTGMEALLIKNETAPLVPFILITGSINEEVAVECMKAGADDYIIKSNFSRLRAAMDEVLKKKEVIESKMKIEEALMESEKIFSSFMEYCPVYFFFKDNEAKPIRLSRNFDEMLGIPVSEAIGKSMYDLFPEDLAKKMIEDDLKVMRENVPLKVVEKLGERIFETTKFPIRMHNNISYLAGFTVDVTERVKAEEALNVSEQRFKQIAEIAGEWIWEVDSDGLYTYISKMGEIILGYTADEIIRKKHFYDFFVPERRKEIKEQAMAAFKAKQSFLRFENENVHKDGHVVILETTGIPLVDENNDLIGYRGVDTDITNRKKANQELIETKERFRSVFENTLIGLYRTTPDGKILLVNPTLVRMLGYANVDELLDRNLEESGFEPSYPRQKFKDMIEKNGKVEGFESSWVKKDGTVVYIRESAVAIRNTNGETMFYEGNIEDITESKLKELEILKLYHGIEQSPAAVAITDTEGKIQYINRKFTETLGYQIDELKGQILRILKPGHTSPEEFSSIWNTLKTGHEWKGELLNHRKGGEEFWESVLISPVKDNNGSLKNFILISEDITLRKRMESELIAAKEKAEESDKLKTAFLHNISHEIRTPMNAIVGFSTLLENPDLANKNIRNFAEIIRKSSDQLLSIISDIVNIATVDAGQEKLNLREVKLNKVLSIIHEQFRLKAAESNLSLNFHPGLPDEKASFESDETKLIQVLTNLLNNAFKFTEKGRIDFGYELNKGILEFYVEDTGIGISEKAQKKVFERFFQVDSSLSRKAGGTGLGLSLSKAYVELMGGEIWVRSSPGEGCKFFFTVPYNRLNTDHKLETGSVETINIEGVNQKTILIAEDEDTNYMLLKYILGNHNLHLVRASNGIEAVELFKKGTHFDLIIMDIKMPLMDGIEATRLIREMNPDVPVIALTAYAQESDKQKILTSGFNAYISKPFNKAGLITVLEKYLFGMQL